MSKRRQDGEYRPAVQRRKLKEKCNTTKQLNRIYRRDRGICYWCRENVNRVDASREHLLPLAWFGTRGASGDFNIVLAHKECNR